MKKAYQSPRIGVELFEQTQHSAGCSGIKIGLTDAGCVLADSDSTPGMLDFAVLGFFLGDTVCAIPVPDPTEQDEEKICYHTSVYMAFTS